MQRQDSIIEFVTVAVAGGHNERTNIQIVKTVIFKKARTESCPRTTRNL